jgi:hypothetical protein
VPSGRIARPDAHPGADKELGKILLTPGEVRRVAAFLRSLQAVPREQFRDFLVDVVIQPVELDFSE